MLSRVNSGFLCASPHVSRAVPDGRGSSCERPTPARFRSSYSARPHDRVVYPRSRVSRRPMQPGDRRGLAFKSAPRLCTRPPRFCKYANRCLTSRFCSVTFRPMHNHTRLTARRIKLLIAALAAEECSLIENELWRDVYPSEKAAREEIDATYAWLFAQLDKREKAVA